MSKKEAKRAFHLQGDLIDEPKRGTKYSAGYDLRAAEDVVIPSYWSQIFGVIDSEEYFSRDPISISEMEDFTKKYDLRPTMVETNYSVDLLDDEYAMVVPRSSISTKTLLILPNSVGVIDKDFHPHSIKVPLLNLSPLPVKIKKGERIAQAIIHKYGVVDNDDADKERTGGFGHTGKE